MSNCYSLVCEWNNELKLVPLNFFSYLSQKTFSKNFDKSSSFLINESFKTKYSSHGNLVYTWNSDLTVAMLQFFFTLKMCYKFTIFQKKKHTKSSNLRQIPRCILDVKVELNITGVDRNMILVPLYFFHCFR
jgi:hypothetical protein